MNVLTQKRMLTFFIASLAGLLVSSCKGHEPLQERGGGLSDHLFTGIIYPDGFDLTPIVAGYPTEGSSTYRGGVGILLKGDCYRSLPLEYYPYFLEKAIAFGDKPIKGAYYHVDSGDGDVFATSVESIRIEARTDYDASHPAGSSLSDIVELRYDSYDHIFPNALPKLGENIGMAWNTHRELMTSFKPVKYLHRITERDCSVVKDEAKGVMRNDEAVAFFAVFKVLPTTPHQKFLVTLSLGDGQKFQGEVEVDVVDHKPVV